jgi:ABC-type glycerol-3-phosphate transport system substrate-binding protein
MEPRIAEPAFVGALAGMMDEKRQVAIKDEDSVPVLGYSDRMAAVTSSTKNAASAFKLLEWLATAEISTQLAAAGDGTLPVRRSLATSANWHGEQRDADERSERAKTLGEMLSSDRFLIVPRIPSIDDYIKALDEAVTSATNGGVSPQVALQKAARRWAEITETRGRDGQRVAYMKHLGI